MREHSFRIQLQSSAPPEAIFTLIEDVPGWTKWAPMINSAHFAPEGSPRRGGKGAVRRVGIGFIKADEEILDDRPPHYQRYTITKGLPVSGYVAEVHIEPLGSGSALLWIGRFTTRVPGLGVILRAALRLAVGMIAMAAISAAERGQLNPNQYATG